MNNIMQIGFISLMSGSPWGGSEELWVKVANKSLDENNKVLFSVKEWDTMHPKLQQLIDKGAKCYWRKELKSISLLDKLINRFKAKYGNFEQKKWEWIVKEQIDAACINLGGPYDILSHLCLIEILNKEKIDRKS